MIQIIDNFYSSSVELLQLSESCLNTGCGSGIRSDDLSLITPKIYSDFKTFIFSRFQLDDTHHHLMTHLTKHTYTPELTSRIHIDGRNPNSCEITKSDYKLVLCGMVFLSPSIDKNSGISFYEADKNIWSEEEQFDICLNQCYTYNKQQLDNYHNNFYETVSVKNIQNRFVSWTAGSKHRNFITEKQNERIVQNFYVSVV